MQVNIPWFKLDWISSDPPSSFADLVSFLMCKLDKLLNLEFSEAKKKLFSFEWILVMFQSRSCVFSFVGIN